METIEIKKKFLTETKEKIFTFNDEAKSFIDFSRFYNSNKLLFTIVCVLNAIDRIQKQNDDIIQKSKAEIFCIKISQYQSISKSQGKKIRCFIHLYERESSPYRIGT